MIAAAAALLFAMTSAAGTEPADLVVLSAKIWTGDPARREAQALAARGGRILAVGSSAEIERLHGPGTRVFDAAEQSGAILFVDEADALFGKRSEVHDSHDRYANIEINYLLQRMEDYRGLAILATNRKSLLDQAFLRRLRFLIDFPLPTAADRLRIWRGAFPAQAQMEPLDYDLLGRLEVSGGSITNIALNAAFLAASEQTAIGMNHVLVAARREYAKIDKLILESEFGRYYKTARQ